MKIYTGRGDRGETGLLGGERVLKTDPRVEAYGTVDELNASLGLALALDGEAHLGDGSLAGVQDDLFAIGARLAAVRPEEMERRGTIPALDPGRVREIERRIDRLEGELPALGGFILPGGSPAAAQLHVARTVCRRAERAIAGLLSAQPELGDLVIPYMNRLSDLLFSLARAANLRAGRADVPWRFAGRRGPRGEAPPDGGAA